MKFIERTYITCLEEDICFDKNNRCFTLNKEKALDNEFTQKDINIFKRRIKKVNKSLDEYEQFLECCEIKIGILNGRKIIIDGQARFWIVNKINTENKGKGTILIPALFYELETEKEKDDAFLAMNRFNTNWNRSDYCRHAALTSSNPLIRKVHESIISYAEKSGVPESFISETFYGNSNNRIDVSVSNAKIWEFAEDFMDFLCDLYDACEKTGKWEKQEMRRIKSQSFIEVMREEVYKPLTLYNPSNLDYCKDLLIQLISNDGYNSKGCKKVAYLKRDIIAKNKTMIRSTLLKIFLSYKNSKTNIAINCIQSKLTRIPNPYEKLI